MKVMCSWCNSMIRWTDEGPTSHGICPACFRSVTEEAMEAASAETVVEDDGPWRDVGGEAGGA